MSDSFYFIAKEKNKRLLNTLDKHSVKAALFVQGKNMDSSNGQKLLKEWDDRGHQISNHTYSYLSHSSNKVTFDEFSKDILKAENLIKGFPHFEKFFVFLICMKAIQV